MATSFAEALEMVRKDEPSAGDVHVTTALGNNRRSRRRDFKDSLRQRRAVARSSIDPDQKRQATNKAWSLPLTIAKIDADQRLIFGWASVVEKNGEAVIDSQGDIILPDDLEKAAYDFVLYYRENDDMHTQDVTGRCIESMVFTKQKQQALGVDLGKVGWWVGFRVDNDALWEAHKRGDRPEFSIGGMGVREKVA